MKFRRTIFAFGLLTSLSAFAGFEEGLSAYKRQDYAQALQEWRSLAEQGDARAQNSLGAMYWEGFGVDRDDTIALQWFTKAAQQGLARAQFNLGMMYGRGEGTTQDQAKAVEWLTKSAEQGVSGAQYYLGMRYVIGRGVSKDEGKAALWFSKAADQGDGDAKMELRNIVEKYHRHFRDIKTAADARSFITTYSSYDPEGLIPQAQSLERSLAQKQEDDLARQRLEDEIRLQAEILEQASLAQKQAAASKARAQEHKRLVAWRGGVRVGSKTNCGPVIEVRGNLIKVYAPVANYSSEHWLERDTLFPPEYECSWYNGNYMAPRTN